MRPETPWQPHAPAWSATTTARSRWGIECTCCSTPSSARAPTACLSSGTQTSRMAWCAVGHTLAHAGAPSLSLAPPPPTMPPPRSVQFECDRFLTRSPSVRRADALPPSCSRAEWAYPFSKWPNWRNHVPEIERALRQHDWQPAPNASAYVFCGRMERPVMSAALADSPRAPEPIRGRLRHIFSNGARHAAAAAGSLPSKPFPCSRPPGLCHRQRVRVRRRVPPALHVCARGRPAASAAARRPWYPCPHQLGQRALRREAAAGDL